MDKIKEIKRLTEYRNKIQSCMGDKVPTKHSHRFEQYVQYLKKELQLTNSKLEQLKGV